MEQEGLKEEDITYPGFVRHSQYDHIGGVPDGIRQNEILVEIKCPERFSKGTSPPQFYVSQMQVYMQIFDLKQGHYVEYIRGKGMRILTIERDNLWWTWVLPLIRNYWNEVLYWRTNDIHYHPEFPGCQCDECKYCTKFKKYIPLTRCVACC